jgi:hypothetical protein
MLAPCPGRPRAASPGWFTLREDAMLKPALSLTILLLAGAVAPAVADDCLEQVDNLTVLYDLPASEAMAGTQTGRTGQPVKEPDNSATLSGLRHFPAGRPGAPTAAEETPLPEAMGLANRQRLTAAQRKELLSTLYEARAAEALSNEAQCLDLLKKAQAIPGKKS